MGLNKKEGRGNKDFKNGERRLGQSVRALTRGETRTPYDL